MYRMELVDINNIISKMEGWIGKWVVERVGCIKMDYNIGIRLVDLIVSMKMVISVFFYLRLFCDVMCEYFGILRVEDLVEEFSWLI